MDAQAKATKLLQPLLRSQPQNGTASTDSEAHHHVPVTFRAAAFARYALQHPMPKVSFCFQSGR